MTHPLETYASALLQARSTGAATRETSYYPILANLLNEVGKALKPRVLCVMNLANHGAGLPDGGLFTPDQLQRGSGEPVNPTSPARGVIEVKSTRDDAWIIADGEQVSRYWNRYGQVLVTSYRDFVLVGRDAAGQSAKLETFRLADSEREFWSACAHPRKLAADKGARFVEFLRRVLGHAARLTDPGDVAWYLASYAREAAARIEGAELPALASLREALSQSLGLAFEGEKGEHFFRSTFVQTLFYGVFSAWVLWHGERPGRKDRFEWRKAAYSLRVPMIQALFYQVANPAQLEPFRIAEVLDWTEAALNRVERADFFARFEAEHAVQYFYEPFLAAFDPELRKELGVWYTPPEVVKYMVARVDRVLREELDIADGLADKNVYILDPCCGTGAYLVEVLDTIARGLAERGDDALLGSGLKRAAMERVFGFEILTAPYVIAHLQLGLLLQRHGAPLAGGGSERAGVYLTNSLTGWEPPKEPKTRLLFPELEQERDAAEKVKREAPILVILGNPPYNGFAGIAMAEERDLSDAYRTTKRAPKPQGQGLNDLYVRFYRMAERRIVEQTGRGVVCLISNYSWLDSLSFTGMREKYLSVFDRIWIDNLHGDRKISEYAPDGKTSETVFALAGSSPGIKVGTAIALLAARTDSPAENKARIRYRDFTDARAAFRRQALLASANDEGGYSDITPVLELGFPFKIRAIGRDYLDWPLLPDLFPVSFPGVKTSRDDLVVDIDRDSLERRMESFFDPKLSHEDAQRLAPVGLARTAGFDLRATREVLLKRGFLRNNVVPFCYRPFDTRWLYWEPETKLLDRNRAEAVPNVFEGNVWLAAAQRVRKEFDPPVVTSRLSSLHIIERTAIMFPMLVRPKQTSDLISLASGTADNGTDPRPNLSPRCASYIDSVASRASFADLFFHVVAVLHSGRYGRENAGAFHQDWPRIPLPRTREALEASAALGREVAALLDTESAARGVTQTPIRPELRVIGNVASEKTGAPDLALTAGWGHAGKGGVVMPGSGKLAPREYTPDELAAIEQGAKALGLSREAALALLGARTFDVYLNGTAYWKNVPANVWTYTIGGYQVVKKWLSYRERDLLGRDLKPEEAHEVRDMARRIAALLLLQPALDANYRAIKADTFDWSTVIISPRK